MLVQNGYFTQLYLVVNVAKVPLHPRFIAKSTNIAPGVKFMKVILLAFENNTLPKCLYLELTPYLKQNFEKSNISLLYAVCISLHDMCSVYYS